MGGVGGLQLPIQGQKHSKTYEFFRRDPSEERSAPRHPQHDVLPAAPEAARLCSRSQNASSAALCRDSLTSAVQGKPPDIKKKRALGLKKKYTYKT